MKYYFTYLKSLEIPTNVPSKARGGTVPPRPPHQIRLWSRVMMGTGFGWVSLLMGGGGPPSPPNPHTPPHEVPAQGDGEVWHLAPPGLPLPDSLQIRKM